jgi:hypothetical protein
LFHIDLIPALVAVGVDMPGQEGRQVAALTGLRVTPHLGRAAIGSVARGHRVDAWRHGLDGGHLLVGPRPEVELVAEHGIGRQAAAGALGRHHRLEATAVAQDDLSGVVFDQARAPLLGHRLPHQADALQRVDGVVAGLAEDEQQAVAPEGGQVEQVGLDHPRDAELTSLYCEGPVVIVERPDQLLLAVPQLEVDEAAHDLVFDL